MSLIISYAACTIVLQNNWKTNLSFSSEIFESKTCFEKKRVACLMMTYSHKFQKVCKIYTDEISIIYSDCIKIYFVLTF